MPWDCNQSVLSKYKLRHDLAPIVYITMQTDKVVRLAILALPSLQCATDLQAIIMPTICLHQGKVLPSFTL